MKSSEPPRLSISSNWLLLLGALLALALVLVTQLPAAQDEQRLVQGGRTLRQALVTRARLGDLPNAAGTPGVWALGRAAAADHNARSEAYRPALETTLASLDQVRSARPARQSSALRLAGISLGILGRYPEAEQALRAAQAVRPGDPFAALALGNALDAQGRREAALAAWLPFDAQRAISFQLYRRGTTLYNSLQNNGEGVDANQVQGASSDALRREAEQMMLRAAEIDPANADALHALGGFYWAQDQQKAAEYYRAALAAGGLEPFFELIAQARIAIVEGRLEDARAALEEAVRLRPNHAEANHLLGVVLGRLGRPREALTYLERAAGLSPNAFWPLVEQAQIYVDLGEYDRAIAAAQQAIQRRSDEPNAFALLAQAYMSTDQGEQAAAAWQRAIDLSPNNALYYVRLGDAWQLAGKTQNALDAYHQALKLDPNNGRASGEIERLGG